MKKFISLFLATTIIASTISFSSVEAYSKYTPYKKILNRVQNSPLTIYSQTGFLFDFNKDGTKELVYKNTIVKNNNGNLIEFEAFSFYTLKKEKLKKIVKNKKILALVASSGASVAVATKKGKNYLIVDKSLGGGHPHHKGVQTIILYKFSNNRIKKYKTFTCSYELFNASVVSLSCKIGKQKCSFAKFKKELKTYKIKKGKLKFSGYSAYLQTEPYQKSLSDLANSIK